MKIEYMKMAFDEALKAFNADEVPVGAVIVKDDEVLSFGHNLKESMECAIYHAEILAIIDATRVLKNWRLDDCDMYITLEPCPMCASAIKQSRIKNVYCGLSNLDENNTLIIRKIFEKDNTNNGVEIFTNLYVDEVQDLMRKFFVEKRKK